MPKLNLHLYTDKAIEPEDIEWNDSLLAKDVVINRQNQKKALKVILCKFSSDTISLTVFWHDRIVKFRMSYRLQ